MPPLSNEAALRLVETAKAAAESAYAPYSRYRVGAAILTPGQTVFSGANVENRSFGGTICAERSAIIQMVMAGETRIHAVAIATPDGGFPCGICLQMIAEFAPDPGCCFIVVPNPKDESGVTIRTLSECAPYLWRSDRVKTIH